MSSDDQAIALAIDDTSAEIDQVIERMRKDQAEIDQLKAEIRAMLKELMDASAGAFSGNCAKAMRSLKT